MESSNSSHGPVGLRPFFVPKRTEPAFQPTVAPPAFVLALAERVFAAHEVLARRAERREVIVSETYYPLE